MGIFSRKKQEEKAPPSGGTFEFREMFAQDVREVLNIVAQFDEDDAEEIDEQFRSEGLTGFYIAIVDKRIAGAIGARVAEDAPTTAWLAWLYVHEDIRRKGVGKYLFQEMAATMQGSPLIRIFAPISDYTEDGEDVYAPARALAKNLGATEDLYIQNFYDRDEGRHIYRLNLQPEPSEVSDHIPRGVEFEAYEEIDESDGTYVLTWLDTDPDSDLDLLRLKELMSNARNDGAHTILAAFPKPVSDTVEHKLTQAGLSKIGSLKNYFEAGIDAVYWSKNL